MKKTSINYSSTSVGLEVSHPSEIKSEKKKLKKVIEKNKFYFLMVLPAVIALVVFAYIPMYGLLIAFQDYHIGSGFLDGPWVGLKHFKDFVTSMYFARTMKNTLLLGLYSVLWSFPVPIIFALFINEVKNRHVKKLVQTVSYFPHFISVVVLVGMLKNFLDPNYGIINTIIQRLGGTPINFMNESGWFRTLYVGSGIWQGFGWSSIIILSALTSIDPTVYESAEMDGANRFQKMFKITLPSIVPTLTILLIMNLGGIMNASLEKVLLMYQPAIWDVSDVVQTYVYRKGILEGAQSFGTAVGLFNSIINVSFLIIANKLARKLTGSSLW